VVKRNISRTKANRTMSIKL